MDWKPAILAGSPARRWVSRHCPALGGVELLPAPDLGDGAGADDRDVPAEFAGARPSVLEPGAEEARRQFLESRFKYQLSRLPSAARQLMDHWSGRLPIRCLEASSDAPAGITDDDGTSILLNWPVLEQMPIVEIDDLILGIFSDVQEIIEGRGGHWTPDQVAHSRTCQ